MIAKIASFEQPSGSSCLRDFFKDTPWLNVPAHRQATFIAPLLPRGGLLGGSSDGAPKMSKLQALAAARKKKTQDQKSSSGAGTGIEKPLESLSLSENVKGEQEDTVMENSTASKGASRGFPLRKRKDSNPHEKAPAPSTERDPEPIQPEDPVEDEPLDQAQPSAFANTMFSNTHPASQHQHPSNLFSLPYAVAATTIQHDPFAGPSPDDVVIAAQSKGSTEPVRPQKQN